MCSSMCPGTCSPTRLSTCLGMCLSTCARTGTRHLMWIAGHQRIHGLNHSKFVGHYLREISYFQTIYSTVDMMMLVDPKILAFFSLPTFLTKPPLLLRSPPPVLALVVAQTASDIITWELYHKYLIVRNQAAFLDQTMVFFTIIAGGCSTACYPGQAAVHGTTLHDNA